MNNKLLGNKFEKEVCEILSQSGYWVHFITPDARGAQPFDIIAVRDKMAYAIECKTLANSRRYFTIDRLEDNQRLAFSRWMMCRNGEPIIAVKQGTNIIGIEYADLINLRGRIDIYKAKESKDFVSVNGFRIYGRLYDLL